MGVRYLCLLLCPLVINRLMIRYGTIPGLAALSIQDALHYLPKSFCEGMGRQRTALVLTVLHTLVFPCLVTRVLAGRFGMAGIYAAFAVHEILLALICGLLWLCAGRQAQKRLTGGGDWDRTLFALERQMHTFADVTAASKEVLRCCRKAGIHERQAVHIALCLEELGTNSIEHNTKLRHPLRLSARFIIGEKWLILRMRNNGRPYDLTERYAMLNPKEPTSHIGLRLVRLCQR